MDSVHFSYKKGEEVIKGVSLSVQAGQMVAIVGYTGSGKTTLANLLTRFWDLDSGDIRLDGIPLKDIPLSELRRTIQSVSQDVFLFSGSIEENIRMGTDITEEKMRQAARLVGADDFIMSLPEGYQSKLSEGASNISAGQRQLISFARALAHNPQIIILDEATSNVDTETEQKIQRGMDVLLADRTSIVIAHRLSTIQHADRIFVLSHGRIAEQGNHQELLKKRGLYYELYRLQFQNEA